MGRAIIFLVVALFSGCAGYTVGPIQPTYMAGVHKLAVPIFDNKTYEPQIQTLVTTTFIKHLHNKGTSKNSLLVQDVAQVLVTKFTVTRVKARSVIGNVLASSQFN